MNDAEPPQSTSPSGSSEGGIRLSTQLFILLALLSIGPLFVTNLVGYLTSRRDTVELALTSLERAGEVAALQTEQFLEENRRLIRSLAADNHDLIDRSRQVDSRSASNRRRARLALDRHLRAKTRTAKRNLELYVVDADGVLFGESTPSTHDRAPEACRELTTSETRSMLDRPGGKPVFFHAQSFPADSARPIGFLCGRRPFRIDPRLPETVHSEHSVAAIALAEDDGTVLAQIRARTETDRRELSESLAGHLGERSSWSGHYQNSRGDPGLAALTPVEGTPWTVATRVSRDRVLASLVALRRRVAWLGGGLFLVVLLGIGFTVRKTVGPIEDLVGAVQEMRDGALDQRVDVRGPLEVASLSSAFNDMSGRLVELRDELEDRVRRRTRELERSRAFTELLFDSMSESLVVIDEHREIVKANAAAGDLYGSELQGERCYRVFEDRDSPCTSCPVERVLQSGEPFEDRRVHRCRNGSEIVELQGFPLPETDADSAAPVLLVGRVITEETREEQQLIHQEKMAAVGLLSAGIAHEIGNPLASIKSQLQTVRRLDDPEITEETFDVIDDEVDRIRELLRSVSSFSRRRDPSEEGPVSLNRVVQDVERLLEHDPRGRNVELVFDLFESVPSIRADENRLSQVLLNLGLNAIAAVDGSGTVRFETFAEERTVGVRVTDTGSGVPDSIRNRIFEPYFTTKSEDEGTGLGLFVSRRIVREAGGEIELEPPGSARGASFVVRLPRHDPTRSASERTSAEDRRDV